MDNCNYCDKPKDKVDNHGWHLCPEAQTEKQKIMAIIGKIEDQLANPPKKIKLKGKRQHG